MQCTQSSQLEISGCERLTSKGSAHKDQTLLPADIHSNKSDNPVQPGTPYYLCANTTSYSLKEQGQRFPFVVGVFLGYVKIIIFSPVDRYSRRWWLDVLNCRHHITQYVVFRMPHYFLFSSFCLFFSFLFSFCSSGEISSDLIIDPSDSCFLYLGKLRAA